jgi:hypothetical protein
MDAELADLAGDLGHGVVSCFLNGNARGAESIHAVLRLRSDRFGGGDR